MKSTDISLDRQASSASVIRFEKLFVCTVSLTLVSDPTSRRFIRWLLFQMFIYIYIQRERERERNCLFGVVLVSTSVYIGERVYLIISKKENCLEMVGISETGDKSDMYSLQRQSITFHTCIMVDRTLQEVTIYEQKKYEVQHLLKKKSLDS